MTRGDAVGLIKESLAIADLIGRYVPLKKKGQRLIARCPFHNEKTPSFNVNNEKGFYHCFGCGKGGDLIDFAMNIEGLEFVEALDLLAEIAGIELPKTRHSGPGRDVIESLRTVYAEATDYYHRQLIKSSHAMTYLEERGIKDTTSRLFKLGLAPNQWDGLFSKLKDRFEPGILNQSGLFRTGQTGKAFDLFRDRIMFPIHDAFGHVIAFGGRLFSGEEGPKYINSPESPLYTKGKHVFNLNMAKAFLKKSREVIVVEGYMDAVQVYQAGIGGVIAGLGTAFTPEQAKLLKRYADKAILNFDGDPAGFKAARAGVETFLKIDMALGIVTLPDNQDPDDFLQTNGVDVYRDLVAGARDFYSFLLEYLAEGKDLSRDPRQCSFVAQEICRTLHHASNPSIQAFYLKKLSEDLGMPTHVIDQIFSSEKPKAPRAVGGNRAEVVQRKRPEFDFSEREFLFHVIHQKNFLAGLAPEHQDKLPQILRHVFSDREWVLPFIFHEAEAEFETRLESVPEEHRSIIRKISFEEAFCKDNEQRVEELFPDLLRKMLAKLVNLNREQIKALPPHEETRKRMLIHKNFKLKQQYDLLLKT